ncbi:MAG: hypothetical protein PHC97_01435 [Patescibacteria group bacterium]|nr:hypothetical protein [Patescibacteria group bacterium]
MVHEKDLILAIKQVVGLDRREILLSRLKGIHPVDDKFSGEQLDKIFDGMPDLRKIFREG